MQSHNFGFTVLKGWRLLQGNIVGFMWLLYLHDFIAVVAVDPTFENSVSRCKAKQAAAHHMLVYCSDPVQCWCSTISLVLNIISFLLISPLILLLMHYMKHSGVNFHHHSKDLWGVFLCFFWWHESCQLHHWGSQLLLIVFLSRPLDYKENG